jgi:hypothetical protein
VVDCILDAGGGELLLIGEGDDAVIGGDVGPERDTGGRKLWLDDGARVLGAKGQRNKKWKGSRQKTHGDRAHLGSSDGRGLRLREDPTKGFAHFEWTDHSDHPMKKYRALGRQGTAGIDLGPAMRK